MNNEIWKDVTSYEGRYQISNMGNARAFKNGKTKLLKQYYNTKGYPILCLWNGEKYYTITIHRLVMAAFVGPCELHVDHINGNIKDNRLENLRYCTLRENNSFGNRKHKRPKTSKYVGVHWSKAKNRWFAAITINKKLKHLGMFKDEEQAHNRYLQAVKELTTIT